MLGSDDRHAAPTRRLFADELEEIVRRNKSLFEALRDSRIFMTGGSGFIGRWLLETLHWANEHLDIGARVVVLTRDPDAFDRQSPHLTSASWMDLLPGDVRTFVFPDEKFDRVIHLAAETNTLLLDPEPEAYFDVILGGTRHVLDFVEHAQAESLLLVSSGAVYGRTAVVERFHEDDPFGPLPTQPGAAYGEAKRSAEVLAYARSERKGFKATVARCFAFVGPYLPLDSGYAVGNFIGDALGAGEIEIRGDGTPRRTYMYAGDMAAWLWSISINGRTGRPYNVGSDETVTIGDLARLVGRLVGPGIDVRILGEKGRVGAGTSYVPDITRARSELGLGLTVDLEEGLKRTLAWHRHVLDRDSLGGIQ